MDVSLCIYSQKRSLLFSFVNINIYFLVLLFLTEKPES